MLDFCAEHGIAAEIEVIAADQVNEAWERVLDLRRPLPLRHRQLDAVAAVSIVIVGAGPNLGRAIAQRFGRERLAVGLIARSADKLRGLTEEVRAEGLTASYAVADIRDAAALQSAIRELADALGPVEVLEYSPLPAKEFMKPILETSSTTSAVLWSSASSAPSPRRPPYRRDAWARLWHHSLHDRRRSRHPVPAARGRGYFVRRRGRLCPHAS